MSEPAAHATTQRALGKQLLLMRAATERAEMVRAIGAARESATFFKSGVPGLVLAQGLPLALGLLKRAPWAGSALSLALSGARRPLLRYALLGAGSALRAAAAGSLRVVDAEAAAPGLALRSVAVAVGFVLPGGSTLRAGSDLRAAVTARGASALLPWPAASPLRAAPVLPVLSSASFPPFRPASRAPVFAAPFGCGLPFLVFIRPSSR